MNKIGKLISSVNQVRSTLKDILALEQDISQKEHVESAEIQKAEKIASRLKSIHNKHEETELLEEELRDFVEAVKLFKNISEELNKTADDLHKIIQQINSNVEQEFKVIEGLSNNKLQIKTKEDIEGLAEAISTSQVNMNNLVEESKQAKKEAQRAQSELAKLETLDSFIRKTDKSQHDFQNVELILDKAKDDLQDAEWKLGEIPDKLGHAQTKSEKMVQEIESNMDSDRRKFVKSAGAIGAAAIVGLPGCMGDGAKNDISVEQLLQEPRKYEHQEVSLQGVPESKGRLSYTVWVYNPATKSSTPQEITDVTYALFSESGAKILFQTDQTERSLEHLNEGEQLGQKVELKGRVERAEKKEGEEFYIITGAKIGAT